MRPASMTLPTTVSEGTLGVSFNDEDKPPMPKEGMRAISAISSAAAASVGEFSRAQSAGLGPLLVGNNAPMPPPAQRINGANGAALAGLAALGVVALASSSSGPANARTTTSGSPPAPPPEAPSARSPSKGVAKPVAERTKILSADKPAMTTSDASLDDRAREVSGKLLDPVNGPVYAPERPKPTLVKKAPSPAPAAASKAAPNAEPFGPPPPPPDSGVEEETAAPPEAAPV